MTYVAFAVVAVAGALAGWLVSRDAVGQHKEGAHEVRYTLAGIVTAVALFAIVLFVG